jgi:hypothetical protein
LSSGDYNGDGYADLTVGTPFEAVNGQGGAGAINVIYGGPNGLSDIGNKMFIRGDLADQNTDENWNFGFALASGDIDKDGKDDLAIGTPTSNSSPGGSVSLILGGTYGLDKGKAYLINNPSSTRNAFFGRSIALCDFKGNGRAELAVGAENDEVNGMTEAGSVTVYSVWGWGGFLSTLRLYQGRADPKIGNTPEENDHFGSVLATGDLNGDGYCDLAIGVPNEDISSNQKVGIVHILYGSEELFEADEGHTISRVTSGVDGEWNPNDRFGAALAIGQAKKRIRSRGIAPIYYLLGI